MGKKLTVERKKKLEDKAKKKIIKWRRILKELVETSTPEPM